MKRIALVLALAVAALSPALVAQDSESKITAAVPACPSTATLDDLIKAIDNAVSGPANQDRTCLRQIMLPDARLSPLRLAPDGAATPRALTVDDWIAAVAKRGSTSFYERQVKVKSEVYGHLAHLWSTYETRDTPDGKAEVRGINSIQAVFDGKQWHIYGITWEAETPAEKVPEKYLP